MKRVTHIRNGQASQPAQFIDNEVEIFKGTFVQAKANPITLTPAQIAGAKYIRTSIERYGLGERYSVADYDLSNPAEVVKSLGLISGDTSNDFLPRVSCVKNTDGSVSLNFNDLRYRSTLGTAAWNVQSAGVEAATSVRVALVRSTDLVNITPVQMYSKTGVFTIASGFSADMPVIVRQTGNHVSICGSIKVNAAWSAAAGTGYIVGTISGVDLPPQNVINGMFLYDKNIPEDIWVNTGGEISFRLGNAQSFTAGGRVCYLNLDYDIPEVSDVMKLMEYKPHINYPNLWAENQEVDLGNGLFGYRATGTITAAAGAETVTMLWSTPHVNIFNSGGWWVIDAAQNTVNMNGTRQNSDIAIQSNAAGTTSVISTSNSARTNAPYDVWFTYIK